jgi:hypothetical protein
MLPRADINTVKAVGHAEPAGAPLPVADARQEAFQRTLSAMLGKSIQAEVLSRLEDGSFLVKVAGTPARMQMPPGVQAGDTVPMTVLSASPRPTFELDSGAGPAVHAAWAYPSGAAALRAGLAAAYGEAPPLADRPAPHESLSQSASLSPAARLLASILQAAGGAPSAAALHGSAPLVGAAAPVPEQLAQQLRQVIAHSGLFYESHVAEWAGGTRHLADLAREPQMQATPGSPAHDPQTARFVNMQLTSQEQARVAWQGELGRGQQLEWDVRRDPPEQQDHDGGAAQPAWRSGLRLRFPGLGEIAATVVLSGDALHLRLQAGSDDAGGMLRAHAPALASALDAAGVPLATMAIGSLAPARHD